MIRRGATVDLDEARQSLALATAALEAGRGGDAALHAELGRKVCVLTIDPARRLAQSMGIEELDNTPRPVTGVDGGPDGVDIRRLALEDFRRNIGIVLQEPFLFRGTIWQNLVYGLPEATPEQSIAAAKAAQAHDFILGQLGLGSIDSNRMDSRMAGQSLFDFVGGNVLTTTTNHVFQTVHKAVIAIGITHHAVTRVEPQVFPGLHRLVRLTVVTQREGIGFIGAQQQLTHFTVWQRAWLSGETLEAHRTFNAFFTRRLRPGARPVDPGPTTVVSPTDSLVYAIGAYDMLKGFETAGKNFGRRKLAPRVSPNKTWEGTLGGLVGATAIGAAGGTWWLMAELGHEVVDLGTDTDAVRVDYPDKARELGEAILSGQAERGVLVCGSGVGASIAACTAADGSSATNTMPCSRHHSTHASSSGACHRSSR